MSSGSIHIRGARQHNLKNLDIDIHTGELTVVSRPSVASLVEVFLTRIRSAAISLR